MREYKFRGKRVDNGEWVYGNYFIDERDIEDGFIWRDIPQIQQRYGDHYQYYDVDPSTVGQYTGLKDKNNKEIYEGDIIKGTYYDNLYKTEKEVICQVRWDKSGYWTFSGTINFLGGYLSDLRNQIVIGNIYENPELLKENG